MTTAGSTPPTAPVPQHIRILYAFGSIAYGIKDNGFSVFLLLYYNQVVGLDAGLVGLVLLIALFLDALIDPAVGHLSDRTRTRWGRRHPWLYASALPIAVSWIFLWLPPEGNDALQLGWLLLFATLVRMSLSVNEVPSIAMAPEMTSDYHERTAILGWRYLFGWGGGLAILAAAYGIFQLADPDHATPADFRNYAITGAIVMFVSVLVSALGTHRRYAKPMATDAHQPALRDLLLCVRYRPFLLLLLAAFFAFANQGVTFALSSYLLGYVWQFGWEQQVIYAFSLFAGVLFALTLARRMGYRYGKRGAAVRLAIAGTLIGITPYVLVIASLFPTTGTIAATVLFLPIVTLATACSIGVMITASSMMADVTTAHQHISGKQQEGVFYAGWFFMQKCVTGVGIFVAGQVLVFIAFPKQANPATIAPVIVRDLASVYVVLTLILGFGTAWALSRCHPFAAPPHDGVLAAVE